MLRFIIQIDDLRNPMSTKFLKVKEFTLSELEKNISILECSDILLENCKIIVQSVKILSGSGRLYLSKHTIARQKCIISIKNDDTICLVRSIITAFANLKLKNWTKTQIQDGFNR